MRSTTFDLYFDINSKKKKIKVQKKSHDEAKTYLNSIWFEDVTIIGVRVSAVEIKKNVTYLNDFNRFLFAIFINPRTITVNTNNTTIIALIGFGDPRSKNLVEIVIGLEIIQNILLGTSLNSMKSTRSLSFKLVRLL